MAGRKDCTTIQGPDRNLPFLILAAADYAEDNTNPMPHELRQAFLCKQWGLPKAGGLDDQPAGLVDKMTVCLNVYHAMRSFGVGRADFATWAQTNPEYMDTWLALAELRENGE